VRKHQSDPESSYLYWESLNAESIVRDIILFDLLQELILSLSNHSSFASGLWRVPGIPVSRSIGLDPMFYEMAGSVMLRPALLPVAGLGGTTAARSDTDSANAVPV